MSEFHIRIWPVDFPLHPFLSVSVSLSFIFSLNRCYYTLLLLLLFLFFPCRAFPKLQRSIICDSCVLFPFRITKMSNSMRYNLINPHRSIANRSYVSIEYWWCVRLPKAHFSLFIPSIRTQTHFSFAIERFTVSSRTMAAAYKVL